MVVKKIIKKMNKAINAKISIKIKKSQTKTHIYKSQQKYSKSLKNKVFLYENCDVQWYWQFFDFWHFLMIFWFSFWFFIDFFNSFFDWMVMTIGPKAFMRWGPGGGGSPPGCFLNITVNRIFVIFFGLVIESAPCPVYLAPAAALCAAPVLGCWTSRGHVSVKCFALRYQNFQGLRLMPPAQGWNGLEALRDLDGLAYFCFLCFCQVRSGDSCCSLIRMLLTSFFASILFTLWDGWKANLYVFWLLYLCRSCFGFHFEDFGGGLGISGGSRGLWGALEGQLGNNFDFHRFLTPAGAAKRAHVGAKLEAWCGQVGTFWGYFGDPVGIFTLLR